MANLNKVFLIGNLTRDPELRYTPGGTAVANLGIAVNRKISDLLQDSKFTETQLFGNFDNRQIYTIWNFGKATKKYRMVSGKIGFKTRRRVSPFQALEMRKDT